MPRKSIAEHPIGELRRKHFRVTVNTDNRLMSGTSMTREMLLLSDAFGYGWADLQWFTINAMKSAFIPFDERLDLINNLIKPGYAALMAATEPLVAGPRQSRAQPQQAAAPLGLQHPQRRRVHLLLNAGSALAFASSAAVIGCACEASTVSTMSRPPRRIAPRGRRREYRADLRSAAPTSSLIDDAGEAEIVAQHTGDDRRGERRRRVGVDPGVDRGRHHHERDVLPDRRRERAAGTDRGASSRCR